jgi:hypothetical protein
MNPNNIVPPQQNIPPQPPIINQPTPPIIPQRKSHILRWLIIIILAGVLGLAGYYFISQKVASNQTVSDNQNNNPLNPIAVGEIPNNVASSTSAVSDENLVTETNITIATTSTSTPRVVVKSNSNQIIDCGSTKPGEINEAMSGNTEPVIPALSCLGKLINECKNGQAVVRDDYSGPIKFVVTGAENNNCSIKMSWGDSSGIQDQDKKKYANTYVTCPIKPIKNYFLGISKTQITNTGWGFSFFFELGQLVINNKDLAKSNYGCTGSALNI